MCDAWGYSQLIFAAFMATTIVTRRRYPCRALRFVTTSGSPLQPDVVTAFMAVFGAVVYDN
jgi:acyl-coenzyme A synthetase/AMP-(fatty) acid ligase